jgi:hypothetical protein
MEDGIRPITVLSPSMIESVLKPVGISARYVFVLESDARNDTRVVPRFTVGGSRANKNPNVISLDELREITPKDYGATDIPAGWSRIHEYIYVLGEERDCYGWECRSDWSDGKDTGKEPWRRDCRGANVRRRIWMSSVVKTDQLQRAKQALTEAIQKEVDSGVNSQLMTGVLSVQEKGMWGSRWVERDCVLKLDSIEIYQGGGSSSSDKDKGRCKLLRKISLVDVSCAYIIKDQLPDKELAFYIRERGSCALIGLFDAKVRSHRRRWVNAINYQIAVVSTNLNFTPLSMAPPSDFECPEDVLVFGYLHKRGHFVANWKQRFFILTPFELQYYDKAVIKGRIPLKGSELMDGENDVDPSFSIKTSEGYILEMKADTIEHREMWKNIVLKQINWSTQADKRVLSRKNSSSTNKKSAAAKADENAVEMQPRQQQEEEEDHYLSLEGKISVVNVDGAAAEAALEVEGQAALEESTGMTESNDPIFRASITCYDSVDALPADGEATTEDFSNNDQQVKILDAINEGEDADSPEGVRMSYHITNSEIQPAEEEEQKKSEPIQEEDGGQSGDIKILGETEVDDIDEDNLQTLPAPKGGGGRRGQRDAAAAANSDLLYDRSKLKGLELNSDGEEEEEREEEEFPELPKHIIKKHGNRRTSKVVQGISKFEKDGNEYADGIADTGVN